MTEQALVEAKGLSAGYDANPVLHDIDFSIPAGQVTVLLGHNGAGKTSLARAIFGAMPVSSGIVRFAGEDIARLPIAQRLKRGMVMVPQERAVFPELLVVENLRLAGQARRSAAGDFGQACEAVWALFPILREFAGKAASDLSGGQQRMLAIGMGMVTAPRFMILDEPSLGLSPVLVTQVMEQAGRICRDMGVTILLIEQNVEAALGVADQVLAIRNGEKIYDGPRSALVDASEILALL